MKTVKESKEVTTQLTEQESSALSVLIQAVNIANKVGAYELDDAVVIGSAKKQLETLLKTK
jgi:hypothetical protein